MKAIIYAAGRGTRLGPTYEGEHKILLRFGERSLLEWHLARLVAAGIGEAVVVTGYLQEKIEQALAGSRTKYVIATRTVHNPDFEEGSVLSFCVSLRELEMEEEPVLLMDGDVLYPTKMLRRLIDSPHRTALLLDRDYSTADDDPVLVPVRGQRPVEFRKGWKGEADLVGESIGFFKVDPADLPLLAEETRRRIAGAGRAEPYEEVLRAMVLAGRFGFEDVTSLPWTEIDFPADVVRAEKEVLPAVLAMEQEGA